MWSVQYDDRLVRWLEGISPGMKAALIRTVELIEKFGPANVSEPHVKPVAGHRKLFEIRARGKDGIIRVFYFTVSRKRIILLHGFIKKSRKTPQKEIKTAVSRMKEAMDTLNDT